MAKSPDELNIRSRARRRLIGAVALALAVVVILPMVLDSEPRITGQDIDLRIPAPDKAGEFSPGSAVSEVVEVSSLPDPAVSAVSEVPAAPEVSERAQKAVATGKVNKPEVSVQPAEVRPADNAAVKQPETPQAETRQPEVKKPDAVKSEIKPTTKSAGSYIVQVGAFSNVDTATQQAGKLKAWGFKAYTEVVSGTTRVRVGPYTDRGKADEVRRLLEKHGLHPVITAAK